MLPQYSALAEYYNRLSGYDYGGYYNAVKDYISGLVVELGAGAGLFTERYVSASESALLLDSSPEMLNALSVKLRRHKDKCRPISGDMHSFVPPSKADTVLAVCDVINYSGDVKSLFGHIGGYLKSGGYFIFDISTEYKLRHIIGNEVFYGDYDDLTYIWTNNLSNDFVDMNVTLFVRDSDKYIRLDEGGRQYIHGHDKVTGALKSSGFALAAVINGEDYGELKPESERAIYIAKRL